MSVTADTEQLLVGVGDAEQRLIPPRRFVQNVMRRPARYAMNGGRIGREKRVLS
jgi:hypothetical protein